MPLVSVEARAKWTAARRAFSAACLVLGCASAPARGATAPIHDHWLPGYVFGIWGKSELDVRDDCPSTGAASVRIGASWGTLAVAALTLGVYTPREVRIRCRAEP